MRTPAAILAALLAAICLQTAGRAKALAPPPDRSMAAIINDFAAMGDRAVGTPGNVRAARYIKQYFRAAGYGEVGGVPFMAPAVIDAGGTITVHRPEEGAVRRQPLAALRYNAITPETIGPDGLHAPLVYAGGGELHDFNGKDIQGAIVLLDMRSGKNWLHAASLGARAVIFIEAAGERSPRRFFLDKAELTPIDLPCFFMPEDTARALFGAYDKAGFSLSATLRASRQWRAVTAENVYAMVPGADPARRDDLVIVEAFFDTATIVPGQGPGADEAVSVATLLRMADYFRRNPPARPVLLIATNGRALRLAGLREAVWSLKAKKKELKKIKKQLKKQIEAAKESLDVLRAAQGGTCAPDKWSALCRAFERRRKSLVDDLSQALMRMRLLDKDARDDNAITALARRRLLLRRLGWRQSFSELTPAERRALAAMIPPAIADQQFLLDDAKKRLKLIKKALAFREMTDGMTVQAVISLHLSSHGDGFGAFNRGWLYALKPKVNRVSPWSRIEHALQKAARGTPSSLYRDTLRPSRSVSWRNYLPDRPALGGEVAALAGYRGLSFATVNDSRAFWGTPYDQPAAVNLAFANRQGDEVNRLVAALCRAKKLKGSGKIRNGFATVTGRAKLLLHGELFADHPAPGTVIMAYQGDSVFHAMADAEGYFRIKGVADKKHTLHKVILEGYRFDDKTGAVRWAIDKKQTGKAAYRLKIRRRAMKTDLIMFGARQTTLFDLLEPRTMRYMTKIQLLDGRLEAQPRRFWYSRIDTRSSTIASIFLEPGTFLKLTLSDTVLNKKLILTNGSDDKPEGTGYPVDQWPAIHNTRYRVAKDMWTLLGPRIANLEERGIFNQRISDLKKQGLAALEAAGRALAARDYAVFGEQSARAWALAGRVYNDIEQTQKDVLFGVLFYIALFVPFAFCMERLVFGFANIYKRISAFFVILVLLIAVIYQVHPAFRLAYSPLVVVLAFFIIGLSFLVTLIIFLRFEEEMTLMQRRAQHMRPEEISRWKAFTAAFFLGVSNLRRRRLRTALTCVTLVILTFTIMSFTSVKSMRHQARIRYGGNPPYQGLLLKNMNWRDFPSQAHGIFTNAFTGGGGTAAPRVWLEHTDRTTRVAVPLRGPDASYTARGVIGLGPQEPRVTGLDRTLAAGRWFDTDDRNAVILPRRMAKALGVAPGRKGADSVDILGEAYTVVGVFDEEAYAAFTDLDGEILTPVTFPSEMSLQVTEVEMEAIESGEDITSFQSRYQHIPAAQVIIVPARPLLSRGGVLKAVAVRPGPGRAVGAEARDLVDRFGLALFAGEKDGVYLYNASDTISYSGVPNIMVPLVISVCIVLNTMISSVYERKREIGIYTSIGLAPSHVSFLFVAEALAFAVISVVLGYLVAQTSAKFLAGTTLWQGITVNYSSMAGVAAMLLVITVVLISVVYPSKVAANIAIPDVKRSWKLPPVTDNVLDITLPFLLKYREHESIGGFIHSYFESHHECSQGLFSTGEISIENLCPVDAGPAREATAPESRDCLHIATKVWLAPFDFGIMQWIDVQFCPAPEEKDFLAIKVRIRRESGEANVWQRLNKRFLLELRKQLLVWRSLDSAAQAEYARQIRRRQRLPMAGRPGGCRPMA